MNQEGVIVIFAQSHRSQEMNRQDARERLVELIEPRDPSAEAAQEDPADLRVQAEAPGGQGQALRRQGHARTPAR